MTRPWCMHGHPVGQRERNIDVVLDHDQALCRAAGRRSGCEKLCRSLGDRPAHGSSSSSTFGSDIKCEREFKLPPLAVGKEFHQLFGAGGEPVLLRGLLERLRGLRENESRPAGT